MGDWSAPSAEFAGVAGTLTTASSYGVAVASSASANTKGSWTEIVAAASALPAAQAFMLSLRCASAAAWDVLIDVGIGGAGSEQTIVSNWGFNAGILGSGEAHYFPIAIPASTRVAMRLQAGTGSQTFHCGMILLSGGLAMPSGLSGATAEGADTTVSGGQSVTPGSNTKGSYTQIVASTARAYKGLQLRRFTKNSVIASHVDLVDIAIGAGGSEKIIVPDLEVCGASCASGSTYMPIGIPAGVRLAVRAAGSSTTAWGASIVGFY